MADIIELILTAIFNGMGTAIGLWVFTHFLKPKLDKTRDIFNNGKNTVLE